jgi:nucleoside phosphorylase
MKVGVLCPSRFEYRALDKTRIRRRGWADLVLSGMGKVRAVCGCAELVRRNPDLGVIVLVGFAGGLSAGLRVGTLVEPSTFIEQDYFAEPLEKFPNILRRTGRRLLKGSLDAVMLTQDRFLKENPYAADGHGKKYRRVACDMESYAVVYFCRKAGLRCVVAKLISDAADESADHDFLKACRELAPRLNALVFELIGKLG